MRRRWGALWALVGMVGLVLLLPLGATATAQDDDGGGDFDGDINDDGITDDFNLDCIVDDLDEDGVPDDFNGDGIPDGDASWIPVDSDGDGLLDDCDGDGTPDIIPPSVTGEGGTLPNVLPLPIINDVIADVFALAPDADLDGYPDIPRLLDENGNDIGPDWRILDLFLGEPGVRDLTQEQDDFINQTGLEVADVNNVEFTLADGTQVFLATTASAAWTLDRIADARGDYGLVGGSGSTLTGPCMGIAWSYDDDGQPLDQAFDWSRDDPPYRFTDDPDDGAAIEQVFSSGNPFKVHVDGAVIFTGIAGGVQPGSGPIEHDWFIRLEFLGFNGANVDSGGDPNNDGENRNAGTLNFNEDLPAAAKISGLVAVNGQMDAPETGTGVPDGEGGVLGDGNPFFCIGSGFVDFQGGIPLSAPGVALVFLSTVGMLFNARPALTWGGVD